MSNGLIHKQKRRIRKVIEYGWRVHSWIRTYKKARIDLREFRESRGKERYIFVLPHAARNGGIKVANQWINILSSRGYPAVLATPQGTRPLWMVKPAAAVRWEEVMKNAGPYDTLIFSIVDNLEPFSSLSVRQRVMFAQDVHQEYPQDSSLIYVAVSKRVQDHLRDKGIDAPVVQNFVEREIFKSNPVRRRQNRVGYFPRRGKECAEQLAVKYPQLEFFPIIGNEGEVARALQTCSFFLFPSQGITMYNGRMSGEAFPLPPLEAMASGCIVVGFHAIGGLEYMQNDKNCFLADVDGDCKSLHKRFAEVVAKTEGELKRIRENALTTSCSFSEERTFYQMSNSFIDHE